MKRGHQWNLQSVSPPGFCQFHGAGRGRLFFHGVGQASLASTREFVVFSGANNDGGSPIEECVGGHMNLHSLLVEKSLTFLSPTHHIIPSIKLFSNITSHAIRTYKKQGLATSSYRPFGFARHRPSRLWHSGRVTLTKVTDP